MLFVKTPAGTESAGQTTQSRMLVATLVLKMVFLAFMRYSSLISFMSGASLTSSPASLIRLIAAIDFQSYVVVDMLPPTTQMKSDEKIATRLPQSMGTLPPRFPTLTFMPIAEHVTIARTVPVHAATAATVPGSLSQVIMSASGLTALPIMMPMKRYTQPRPMPISKRMHERPPMMRPKTMTVMREILRMSSEVGDLLPYV